MEKVVPIRVDNVVHKFIQKDKIATHLEGLLEKAHNSFSHVSSVTVAEGDYMDLLTLLEEGGKSTERRKLSNAIGEIVEKVEGLKEALFILEKIAVDTLGITETDTSTDEVENESEVSE